MPASQTKTELTQKVKDTPGKGARAREALMDAGLELLGEISLRELTVGKICAAAQMKRPSFYTYFDSVDDLLDAMIRREIDRVEALYEAHETEDKSALHRLARIPLSLVKMGLRDKNRRKAIVKLMGSDPAFTHIRMQNLRRDIKAAIAEGSLTLEEKQIDIFMQIYVAGILSLVARHADDAVPSHEAVSTLQILLRGAGGDPAMLKEILSAP
ncbi:MAG: TetR/AcrR family transcriptional regulator [Parvularculales bacterium]